MKNNNSRNKEGSSRKKTVLTLIAILVCFFLPVTSASTISSSVLDTDADSAGFFLYKGQNIRVPRSVEHLVIDSSVTNIQDYAFSRLYNLKTVELPDSLESIGDYAFRQCTNLTSIKLPDSLQSIGDYAFYGCTSLASIKLPDSLKFIGNASFWGCTSLASIKFSDSLISIGNHAFRQCTSLSSIKLPDSLESIGDSSFYQCTSLSSIKLPDSIKSIGDYAFYGCTSLASIKVPASTLIGNHAFIGSMDVEFVSDSNSSAIGLDDHDSNDTSFSESTLSNDMSISMTLLVLVTIGVLLQRRRNHNLLVTKQISEDIIEDIVQLPEKMKENY